MAHSFIQFLLEKRSHAALNPKVSINQRISDALKKASKSKSRTAGIWNSFVSMTSIDKLGINPQSEYDTPLGIYAYPAIYVHKQAKDDRELAGVLPFAGEMEHANIFSAKGNIINLGTITDTEVLELYKKLGAVYHKYNKAHGGSWKSDVDRLERIINDAPRSAKVSSLPGGQFWYVTMEIARQLEGNGERKNAPVLWNKIFREIGVDGVVDMGKGIVHTNEPTQAVFFSIGAIGDVDRVNNKYSPDAVAGRTELGKEAAAKKASLAGKSDDELMAMLDNMEITLRDIQRPSERIQQFAVSIVGSDIAIIRNPSEAVQLAAVKSNAKAVRLIKNPTEAVQLIAVEHSSTAIKLLKAPSEKVQLASVTAWPHSIGSINNPSEAVQMACVKQSPNIKNPTAKVKQYVATHAQD
jgi:hypothetical protein